MPENKLQDVIVEELSLVDEPATGITWKLIKRKIGAWFRKQESLPLPGFSPEPVTDVAPEKPDLTSVEIREDLYMIEEPEVLEQPGSFKVYVGYDEQKGRPTDEEAAAFCQEKMGQEIFSYNFEEGEASDGEGRGAYLEGVVWTQEKSVAGKPAVPPLSEAGGLTGGEVPGAGIPPPTGGAPSEPVEARKSLITGFVRKQDIDMFADSHPDALDYALQLTEEFAPYGDVDPWIQMQVYDMVIERYGRKNVSRFSKFVDDLKWWALAYGVMDFFFKAKEKGSELDIRTSDVLSGIKTFLAETQEWTIQSPESVWMHRYEMGWDRHIPPVTLEEMRRMINAYGDQFGIEIVDGAVILSEWKKKPPSTWEKRDMRTFAHPTVRKAADYNAAMREIERVMNSIHYQKVHEEGGNFSDSMSFIRDDVAGRIGVVIEVGDPDFTVPDWQDIPT